MKGPRHAVAPIAVTALLVAAALAAITVILVRRVDAGSARAAIAAELEAALGLPVSLGAAELSLLPVPAVRIEGSRIGGPDGSVVDVPEIVARLGLLALVSGRLAPSQIELVAPDVRLDARGAELGALTARVPAPDPRGAAGGSAARSATRLLVRDGTLEAGSLRLERVALDGRVGVSPAVFAFSAEHARLGPIEDGRLELVEASGPIGGWRVSVSGHLAEVDLGELSDLPDLRGHAAGGFTATVRGATALRASLELVSADFDLHGAGYRVSGHTVLTADLTGAIGLDLGAATLSIGGAVEKPPGVALRISGRLDPRERALLRDLRVDSDAVRATGALDLALPALELGPSSVDLAGLAAWQLPDRVPRGGRVEILRARLDAGAHGSAPELAALLVDVPVPIAQRASASASGRIEIQGTRLRGDDLRVVLAGEELHASGAWDWRARRLELTVSARGPRIAPIAEALWGRKDVSGRVYAQVEVAGPPDLLGLSGFGEFEWLDGELPGISLARAAGLELSFDEPPGLDRFDRLGGSFEVVGDRLDIGELMLVQAYTTAVLQGRFYLRDLTADLTGAVQFDHPELPGPSVRPILRMAGRLDALETHISDAETKDVREMEERMLEAIRKVEAERRAAQAAEHGSGG